MCICSITTLVSRGSCRVVSVDGNGFLSNNYHKKTVIFVMTFWAKRSESGGTTFVELSYTWKKIFVQSHVEIICKCDEEETDTDRVAMAQDIIQMLCRHFFLVLFLEKAEAIELSAAFISNTSERCHVIFSFVLAAENAERVFTYSRFSCSTLL